MASPETGTCCKGASGGKHRTDLLYVGSVPVGKGENMANAFAGVCESVFTLNFEFRNGQKLRRIILLHFGQATFTFHSPEILNGFMLMLFGTSGRSMTPRSHYSWLWTHQFQVKFANRTARHKGMATWMPTNALHYKRGCKPAGQQQISQLEDGLKTRGITPANLPSTRVPLKDPYRFLKICLLAL